MTDDDWSAEVEEIRRRREAAAGMGGPDKVARQHASGRRTARERIDRLADPGSFTEIGALTALSGVPANFVAGTARIDGRKLLLYTRIELVVLVLVVADMVAKPGA